MSSIAVRKQVDHDQFMMKTDGTFIGIVCFVFQPIRCIAQELCESFAHLSYRDAEIFGRLSIRARPLPRLVEHSRMKFANVFFVRRVQAGNLTLAERPLAGAQDVVAFPFVQLFAGGETGDKVGLFLRSERSIRFRRGIVEHPDFLTLFQHAFGFAVDLVLNSMRGLVFESHRVFDRPYVSFGPCANAALGKLCERTVFGNNRIHEFAIESFRIAPQRLERDPVCGFRFLKRRHGLGGFAHLARDFTDGNAQRFADRAQPAALRPTYGAGSTKRFKASINLIKA